MLPSSNLFEPSVMGILNLTPDSFYAGSRIQSETALLNQAEKMLADGAWVLDIGGASSRPGAAQVSEQSEMERVIPAITAIINRFPTAKISIDTWRASVAHAALDSGAQWINDISAGRLDSDMYPTVARHNTPYILMHMQGQPGTMQQDPHYDDVVVAVLDFFIAEIKKLRDLGVKDIILDPGFGFGKTIAHNYTLLKNMSVFSRVTGLPTLAGISRKSMIYKHLNIDPSEALNGTTALHMVALQQGASILRVHDVKEAVEAIRLFQAIGN